MKKQAKIDIYTKFLAGAGTISVWAPVVFAICVSVTEFISKRVFRFDYLMPVECCIVVFLGGGTLFYAALRARMRRGAIGWGVVAMVVMLIGNQVFIQLAKQAKPVGWAEAMAVAALVLYDLVFIEVAVNGALLWRDLLRMKDSGGDTDLSNPWIFPMG